MLLRCRRLLSGRGRLLLLLLGCLRLLLLTSAGTLLRVLYRKILHHLVLRVEKRGTLLIWVERLEFWLCLDDLPLSRDRLLLLRGERELLRRRRLGWRWGRHTGLALALIRWYGWGSHGAVHPLPGLHLSWPLTLLLSWHPLGRSGGRSLHLLLLLLLLQLLLLGLHHLLDPLLLQQMRVHLPLSLSLSRRHAHLWSLLSLSLLSLRWAPRRLAQPDSRLSARLHGPE